MLAKFLGLNSKRPYLCLEKEKNFRVVLTFFVKRVRKSRKFHVAAVQRRLRNVQKRVMHVQSCCFGDRYKPIACYQFSLPSKAWLLKLPFSCDQEILLPW